MGTLNTRKINRPAHTEPAMMKIVIESVSCACFGGSTDTEELTTSRK